MYPRFALHITHHSRKLLEDATVYSTVRLPMPLPGMFGVYFLSVVQDNTSKQRMASRGIAGCPDGWNLTRVSYRY
jgi:hypothetical protein